MCQKCYLFSSIFNIKMATQKFTNFDKFLKCILIWQLPQYNLTKLFQMKLETTALRAILREKKTKVFGQPNISTLNRLVNFYKKCLLGYWLRGMALDLLSYEHDIFLRLLVVFSFSNNMRRYAWVLNLFLSILCFYVVNGMDF